MFKQSVSFLLLLGIFVSSCGEGSRQKTDLPLADTAKFYPFDQFIGEQIRYVDLRNFEIWQKISADSRTDSTQINKQQFIQLANSILNVAQNWNSKKHLYKESVFQDLSTASYTINYTAIDPAIKLQRIDILLNEETNIIKRLFLRESWTLRDTLYTKQYSWLADHGFQVVTTKNYPEYSHTQSIAVDWHKSSGK
ncbi:MAG TPA: hypothetical protein VJ552_03165 [Sediminibacterium sp.]|nr:hypothetical protein [Sediminibacterium sp.]